MPLGKALNGTPLSYVVDSGRQILSELVITLWLLSRDREINMFLNKICNNNLKILINGVVRDRFTMSWSISYIVTWI